MADEQTPDPPLSEFPKMIYNQDMTRHITVQNHDEEDRAHAELDREDAERGKVNAAKV